jgi:predicted transcriptional regulator
MAKCDKCGERIGGHASPRITVRFSPAVQSKLFEAMQATSLTASEIIRVAVSRFLRVDEQAFVEAKLKEYLSHSSAVGTGEPAPESNTRDVAGSQPPMEIGRPGIQVPPPYTAEGLHVRKKRRN